MASPAPTSRGRAPDLLFRAVRNWPEALVTGVVALVLAWLYVALRSVPNAGTPGDVDYFRKGGEAILRGDLSIPYSDSAMQGGPAQLAFDAFLLGWHNGSQASWSIVRFAVMWAFLLSVVLLARPRGSSARQRAAAVALSFVLIAMQQVSAFYRWGHWWHLPVVLLMAWAAGEAASSRWIQAGLLLAMAMWFEPFAVVGVAVLALAPGVWVAVRAAVVAAVGGVLAYLPFVLVGSFAMGSRTWAVSPGTWAALVIGADTAITVTFPLRLLQASVAVALAGAVIWRLRLVVPMPALGLTAAAAAVCARVALEPFWWPYYSLVPFVALAAAALRLAWLRCPAALPVALSAAPFVLITPFSPSAGAAVALVLLALAPDRVWVSVWDRLAVDYPPMRRPEESDFVLRAGSG